MKKENLILEETHLIKQGEKPLKGILKYIANISMKKEFDYNIFGKRTNPKYIDNPN